MENCMTSPAAADQLASYPTHGTPLTTLPFAMSSGTGVPMIRTAGLQVGDWAVAVDQRPRTAKLGRPPRGNHC